MTVELFVRKSVKMEEPKYGHLAVVCLYKAAWDNEVLAKSQKYLI